MALIALVSPKASPGVTTTALACALSWTGPLLLAECDPAGGDILAGYLSSLEIGPMGLLQVAAAALRGNAEEVLPTQVIALDSKQPQQRLLLPGIPDAVQAGSLRPIWDRLADLFAGLENRDLFADPDGQDPTGGRTVIADCGRLASPAPPWPLLYRADLVIVVVDVRSLRTIAHALPTVTQLRRELSEHGTGGGSLALLTIGKGPYPAADIQRQLQLPLAGELPDDTRTATVLSAGGRLGRTAALLRATAGIQHTVDQAVARRRAMLTASPGARRG